MRNDSKLYTGSFGNTTTKVSRAREAREERLKLKTDKRTVLSKSADIIVEEINKEIHKVVIEQLELGVDTNYEALRLYKASMETLKSRISNIMRVSNA